jgi:hypothetical protein
MQLQDATAMILTDQQNVNCLILFDIVSSLLAPTSKIPSSPSSQ